MLTNLKMNQLIAATTVLTATTNAVGLNCAGLNQVSVDWSGLSPSGFWKIFFPNGAGDETCTTKREQFTYECEEDAVDSSDDKFVADIDEEFLPDIN